MTTEELVRWLRDFGSTYGHGTTVFYATRSAAKRLEEQAKTIEKYRKADSFLASHGWNWAEVK